MSTIYQEGSGATRAPSAAPATAALPIDAILGALADGVTAQDSPGHLIYANEAAAHAAGYASAEAMLAAPPADLLRRFEVLDESLQPFPPDALPDRLALQGIPSTETTMCWRDRSTGQQRWSLVSARPVFGPDGAIQMVVNISRDITGQIEQRRALEHAATQPGETMISRLQIRTQEAELAQAAAETANHTKTDFLGVMSHELRTPLNAIIGFAELLRDGTSGPVNPVQVEQLDRIVGGARHLLQLVEDILSFARLENAEETLSLGSADLGVLTREAANLIRPLASERGIELTVDGAPEPITTDQARLLQVLLNLLSNAVKFTDSGEVHLEAHRRGGEVIVRVTDTGTGIEPEHQARIFEPFWQADQSNTRKHEGMGLGLAATKRLVELLGGEVEVESTPGEGSTFTLRLPA